MPIRSASEASVPPSSSAPLMICCTASHTMSGAFDPTGQATRYGRQRWQARNPAASAAAARPKVTVFAASGGAPHPGRQ